MNFGHSALANRQESAGVYEPLRRVSTGSFHPG